MRVFPHTLQIPKSNTYMTSHTCTHCTCASMPGQSYNAGLIHATNTPRRTQTHQRLLFNAGSKPCRLCLRCSAKITREVRSPSAERSRIQARCSLSSFYLRCILKHCLETESCLFGWVVRQWKDLYKVFNIAV